MYFKKNNYNSQATFNAASTASAVLDKSSTVCAPEMKLHSNWLGGMNTPFFNSSLKYVRNLFFMTGKGEK